LVAWLTEHVISGAALSATLRHPSVATQPIAGLRPAPAAGYHSGSDRIHYGRELDWAVAYKVRRVSNHGEIGSRFGRYFSDRLYSLALRVSGYTGFTF
jgi:hypothetical protein